MTTTTTDLSVEDFLAVEWPSGAQLVEGEVIVNAPTFRHQEIVVRIVRRLAEWVEVDRGRGGVGIGGNWTIAPASSYIPDVWWASAAHRPDPESARSDSPPDLVVEVRSPGTWRLDIGPKRAVYERTGVGELWLVDTPARTVVVYRRTSPEVVEFDVALEVGPGEVLATPLLDSFELPFDELFA